MKPGDRVIYFKRGPGIASYRGAARLYGHVLEVMKRVRIRLDDGTERLVSPESIQVISTIKDESTNTPNEIKEIL